jgi:hypothetical protein
MLCEGVYSMVLAPPSDPATTAAALAEIQSTAGLRHIRVSSLVQQGVLVDLTIRRWRAAICLDLDDLGVAVTDDAARAAIRAFMTLGTKRLLPPQIRRELERAEAAGRRALEHHSFATAWGRFVPVTAYAAWKQANTEAQATYWQLRDALVARYGSIMEEVLREYRAAAGQAYANLLRTDPDALAPFATQAAFVDAYCERIRAAIPTPDAIRDSFVYTTTLDCVRLADDEPPDASTPSIEKTADAALDTMHADLLAELRRRKTEEIDDFLTGIVAQLRQLLYEVATDVLAALQRNERLPRNSTKQLKRLVEQISALNFYGDADVTQMLAGVQALIATPAIRRDLREVEETMRAVATLSRTTLLQIGATPRSGRAAVAIPDMPTDEQTRRARAVLQFADTEDDAALLGVVRRARRPAQLPLFDQTGDS